MVILEGRTLSQKIQENVKSKVDFLKNKIGKAPHLCVVLVGEDKASQVYVRNKELACQKVGLQSSVKHFPATISNQDLKKILQDLNDDSSVDAVLVQLPLPKGLDAKLVQSELSYTKDADALTYVSMGRLFSGSFSWKTSVAACTPSGVMKILEEHKIPLAGKKAVVVGRSSIVGKPMAHLLLQADCTVTICHSRTENTRQFTQAADIVVVAAGQRRLLGREDFKQGAVVIDVGIHGSGQGQGLAGDVRFEELEGWVHGATPVPGGVGPLTIAMLLENTCKLVFEKQGLNYADH